MFGKVILSDLANSIWGMEEIIAAFLGVLCLEQVNQARNRWKATTSHANSPHKKVLSCDYFQEIEPQQWKHQSPSNLFIGYNLWFYFLPMIDHYLFVFPRPQPPKVGDTKRITWEWHVVWGSFKNIDTKIDVQMTHPLIWISFCVFVGVFLFFRWVKGNRIFEVAFYMSIWYRRYLLLWRPTATVGQCDCQNQKRNHPERGEL